MKRLMAVLCGLILGLALAIGLGQASGAAPAPAAGYSLSWWTVDGGGWTGKDVYLLGGTIGQPDAGVLGNGAYVLQGGFWPGARITFAIYLPALEK